MSPRSDLVMRGELARCDAEIAAMRAQPEIAPAWRVTLGIEDWESERSAILREADPARWPYLWRWKTRLLGRQGWPCRVVARGSMNSAWVAFPDGFEAITSRNGLSKRTLYPPTTKDRASARGGRVCLAGELRGIRPMYPPTGAPGKPGAGRPSVAPPFACPPGHAGQAQLASGKVGPAGHKPAPAAAMAAGA